MSAIVGKKLHIEEVKAKAAKNEQAQTAQFRVRNEDFEKTFVISYNPGHNGADININRLAKYMKTQLPELIKTINKADKTSTLTLENLSCMDVSFKEVFLKCQKIKTDEEIENDEDDESDPSLNQISTEYIDVSFRDVSSEFQKIKTDEEIENDGDDEPDPIKNITLKKDRINEEELKNKKSTKKAKEQFEEISKGVSKRLNEDDDIDSESESDDDISEEYSGSGTDTDSETERTRSGSGNAVVKGRHLQESLNFQHKPGCHTVKSPVVATRAKELAAVKKAMKNEKVLTKLQESIYKPELIYLIPLTKKDEADHIARELFLNYISKYFIYECTEQNIVEWSYSGMPGYTSNKTKLYDLENETNTWRVQIRVEGRHGEHNEKYGCYLPPHVVAYHELMHAEETPAKVKKTFQKDNGGELLTTIKTFILLDIVYKKIHGLDEDSEVNYGKYINIDGNSIKLGKFANFYRREEKKLGKLHLALISPDSISFLKNEKAYEEGK